MKILSIVIPAYNAEAYLDKCVSSMLFAGNALDIIIVNDGSTDRTGEIADYYAKHYPEIVRAIHKENGGHGSAVNTGLDFAQGLYFYVVDADDWLNLEALKKVLELLEDLYKAYQKGGGVQLLDLLCVNFIYEKQDDGFYKMSLKSVMPTDTMINWTSVKRFSSRVYLTMHSLIYRTELLKKINFRLPEHCFYVDNILAYTPLPHVKNLYYFNVDLYHYLIGREGQSVQTETMIRRIDQQLKVTKLMTVSWKLSLEVEPVQLRRYMLHYLSMMYTISSTHLFLAKTDEALEKNDELWDSLKNFDQTTYKYCRNKWLNAFTLLFGKISPKAVLHGYNIARKLFKFN